MTITRIGFNDPPHVLHQGANPWGSDPWGFGGLTVGAAGCPGTALAEGQRMIGIRAGANPRTVIARALEMKPAVWAPGSSAANLPLLARSASFKCPDESWMLPEARAKRPHLASVQVDLATMSLLCTTAIQEKGFAWINVDHNGDDLADHWVLGYAFDQEWIYCTDSATAKIERLMRKTLAGETKWSGKQKKYRALRAFPLHLA